jgi:hypothetical protein
VYGSFKSVPCWFQLHHHPQKGCDAVQANAGKCRPPLLLLLPVPVQVSADKGTKAHPIWPLRGGIPCVASSLCRDPCLHFTSHHRCGPPIGSPLGPGRLIRLSGWPLAVIVRLELLGLLCSVMRMKNCLSLQVHYLLSPPANRAEIRPRAVGPDASARGDHTVARIHSSS